jgi:hypothetical protein
VVPERCQNSPTPLNTREKDNPSAQSFSLERRVVFFQMVVGRDAGSVPPFATEQVH